MKVKSESEVSPSCLTLSDPMGYSLLGSSVHGIFQARVLEWGAIAFYFSCLVMYNSLQPHGLQYARLPRPWDSPGKNTRVGCHFPLQCMKVKSESEVAQSCPTLVTPWTAAHQASPSMGFSNQKYWSGVPLPSPE